MCSRTPKPSFSLFECSRQKISVLVFLMGQNPKCPGFIKEGSKETSSNISSMCIPSTTNAGAFIQYLPTMYHVQRM